MAAALHNLATWEHAQGHFARAERLYRHALAIKRKVLGVRHPDLRITSHNLAVLLTERSQA